MAQGRTKLKLVTLIVMTVVLLWLGMISGDHIVLTASCGGYGTLKTEKQIPLALDGSPFELSRWQTFRPTAIESFHLNFHSPANAQPVLQVRALGSPELLTYTVHLSPHPDQGTYPASTYGFADGANVALTDPGILNSSGVELFLTEREGREFLCSDSEFKLSGDRENIIASTLKTWLTAFKQLI
jgi:hypothetical protein